MTTPGRRTTVGRQAKWQLPAGDDSDSSPYSSPSSASEHEVSRKRKVPSRAKERRPVLESSDDDDDDDEDMLEQIPAPKQKGRTSKQTLRGRAATAAAVAYKAKAVSDDDDMQEVPRKTSKSSKRRRTSGGAALARPTKASQPIPRRHSTGSSFTSKADLISARLRMALELAQKSTTHHRRALAAVQRLHKRAPAHLTDALRIEMLRVLDVPGAEPNATRLVKFFVDVLVALHREWCEPGSGGAAMVSDPGMLSSQAIDADLEDLGASQGSQGRSDFDEDACTAVLGFLLHNTNVHNHVVRFRVCQLVAGVVTHLQELDNSLWSSIEEAMKERIRDIQANVRAEAAVALCRLQSKDARDEIVDLLVHTLSSDPSALVRKSILTRLALRRQTLPAVLKRLNDRDPSVRKQAFILLKERVTFRNCSPEQRVVVLTRGIVRESHEVVRAAAIDLLGAWFESCDSNVLLLVEGLGIHSPSAGHHGEDVDINETVKLCEVALPFLFERKAASIPVLDDEFFQKLNDSQALVWRILVQHRARVAAQTGNQAILEAILPNVSEFVSFIESGLPTHDADPALASDFATRQLLLVAQELDYADEVGRVHMSELLSHILPRSPPELCPDIIALGNRVWSGRPVFVEKCLYAISELIQPLVSQANDEADMTDDPELLQRGLYIAHDMLQHVATLSHTDGRKLDNDDVAVGVHLVQFCDVIVLPCTRNELPEVREVAVKVLGEVCTLQKSWCSRFAPILLQLLAEDESGVQTAAIEAIGDCVMCFGLAVLDENQEQVAETSSRVQVTVSSPTLHAVHLALSQTPHIALKARCVEVMARWYYCGKVSDWLGLAKLCSVFFEPSTQLADQQVASGNILTTEVAMRGQIFSCIDAFLRSYSALPGRNIQVSEYLDGRLTEKTVFLDPKQLVSEVVMPMFRLVGRRFRTLAGTDSRVRNSGDALKSLPKVEDIMKYLLQGCLSSLAPEKAASVYHIRVASDLFRESICFLDELAACFYKLETARVKSALPPTNRLQVITSLLFKSSTSTFESGIVQSLSFLQFKRSSPKSLRALLECYFYSWILQCEMFPQSVSTLTAAQVATRKCLDEVRTLLRSEALRHLWFDARAVPSHEDFFRSVCEKLGSASVEELCKSVRRRPDQVDGIPAVLRESESEEVAVAEHSQPSMSQPFEEVDQVAIEPIVIANDLSRVAAKDSRDSSPEHKRRRLDEPPSPSEFNPAALQNDRQSLLRKKQEMEMALERVRRMLEDQELQSEDSHQPPAQNANVDAGIDMVDSGRALPRQAEQQNVRFRDQSNSAEHNKGKSRGDHDSDGDDSEDGLPMPPIHPRPSENESVKEPANRKQRGILRLRQPKVEPEPDVELAPVVQSSHRAHPRVNFVNLSAEQATATEQSQRYGSFAAGGTIPDTLNQATIDGYSESSIDNASHHSLAPTTRSHSQLSQIASSQEESFRPVVAFSGFKPKDADFSIAYRDELAKKLQSLGATVIESESMKGVTHVVCPPLCRTLKTVGAAASGRWLVGPGWVDQSYDAGQFVGEMEPGSQGWHRPEAFPFAGKSVAFDPSFVAELKLKQVPQDSIKHLIQMGRGKVVSRDSRHVDILLSETPNTSSRLSVRVLRWAELFDFLQPKVPRL